MTTSGPLKAGGCSDGNNLFLACLCEALLDSRCYDMGAAASFWAAVALIAHSCHGADFATVPRLQIMAHTAGRCQGVVATSAHCNAAVASSGEGVAHVALCSSAELTVAFCLRGAALVTEFLT